MGSRHRGTGGQAQLGMVGVVGRGSWQPSFPGPLVLCHQEVSTPWQPCRPGTWFLWLRGEWSASGLHGWEAARLWPSSGLST